MVVTVLILCLTVVEVAVLLRPRPQPVIVQKDQRSLLDERVLEQVVITLKTGTSFGGVLYAEDRGAVVLCNASQLKADGSKVPADGEIILLRDTIDFVQRP